MKKSVHFTLLFMGIILDRVSGVNMKTSVDFLTVALGGSVTLHCSYNCSSGFVRGCWSKTSTNPGCDGSVRKNDFCTVSLHLSNVSAEDLGKNYTCYTIDTDDVQLSQKTERLVFLQLQDDTKSPNWKVTPNIKINNASLPAKPTDSTKGELTGIKVVAAVTVAVAVVLAALAVYLCLSRNRQSWNCKGEASMSRAASPQPPQFAASPAIGQQSTERIALRIPAPDDESDTEVPYADIMITVRGVSTPELTQVSYLSPGDQKEWWGEEPKSHLQASRSADRLYIPQPREVSRKMSTSSEYAVITYA